MAEGDVHEPCELCHVRGARGATRPTGVWVNHTGGVQTNTDFEQKETDEDF